MITKQSPQPSSCGDLDAGLLMLMATDGLARLFGADLEPLRVVRNLGLNLLDKLPALKRKMISHALGHQ